MRKSTSLFAEEKAISRRDPDDRGAVDKSFERAPVQVEWEYRTPVEHHNPMECFGDDCYVGRRRKAYRLRQDARRAELP